ncbi:hypothetical protein MPDQ_000569 [Monascus purpureus]|uniref:Tryptophan synthase beta chain-like PALP domain-containing protein n=1 Tax=Monascus purpureus TaxID=5098 RepID=A0A507R4M9_MONPU|nr:hypothetical protein MPDQ_000569 [Monascus purpureus]BDD64153.1 hypothetical protein MAP00_008996 [Monascus purpureus]
MGSFRPGYPSSDERVYMMMVEEVFSSVPDLHAFTHVFTCAGAGSIAAAIFMGFMSRYNVNINANPRSIGIELTEADCIYQSSVKGSLTPSIGTLRTVMAGLSYREPSPTAFEILEWLASDFLVALDSIAVKGMKALAEGHGGVPIVGESSDANMGLLIEAAEDHNL